MAHSVNVRISSTSRLIGKRLLTVALAVISQVRSFVELNRTSNIVNKTMLRRKPTRIEMKIDDISEWMAVKKEIESKKQSAESAAQHADLQTVHKTRRDMVNERIGYDPTAGRETTAALPRPLH